MPDETPEHKSEAAAQTQESAPETKNQQESGAGKVDSGTKQTQKGNVNPDIFGLRKDLFEARSKKRDLEQENVALSARLKALEDRESQPQREKAEAKTSVFDDPEKYAAEIEERAVRRAREAIHQDQAQSKRYASAVEAERWLLTRSHVKEDQSFAGEVASRIQQILSEEPNTHPKAAAKAAYLEMCEEKGIDPDLSRQSEISPAHAGSGVRPSAAGSAAGSKEIAPDELRAQLSKLRSGSPEWKAKRAEVERAITEGRYKGRTITLR